MNRGRASGVDDQRGSADVAHAGAALPLLGHEPLLNQLRSALERDRFHHAWLVEGPRGIGKHTFALRLAMLANCVHDGPRPCGVCASCAPILSGNHPDVVTLEPDPTRASGTIPVAAVRELLGKLAYKRFAAQWRVVIVDPVEALLPAAANALLKTLEEPPPGTAFVLCTTGARTLLPTIRSRCQILRLGPVPQSTLSAWLAERGVANPITLAAQAQGCPGRALALADGGQDDRVRLRDLLLDALGGDLATIYDTSKKLSTGQRQSWKAEVDALLDILDDLLRDATVQGAGSEQPLLHPDAAAVSRAWADVLWPEGTAQAAEAVRRAREQLARYVNARTALDALFTTVASLLGKARSARP